MYHCECSSLPMGYPEDYCYTFNQSACLNGTETAGFSPSWDNHPQNFDDVRKSVLLLFEVSCVPCLLHPHLSFPLFKGGGVRVGLEPPFRT